MGWVGGWVGGWDVPHPVHGAAAAAFLKEPLGETDAVESTDVVLGGWVGGWVEEKEAV